MKYAVKYVGSGSELDQKNWVNSINGSLQEKCNRRIFNKRNEAVKARNDRAEKLDRRNEEYRIVRITGKLSRAIERVKQLKAHYEASRTSAVSSKNYIIAGQYMRSIATIDEILTAIRS